MRRVAAVLIAAVVLCALAGCSSGAKPTTWAQRNSQFAVLGSAPSTTSAATTAMPGLTANSVPRDALKGIPGAGEIVVASGTPTVSREQAIALTRPKNGKLVSAVDVVLPRKFVVAALGNSKQAGPTTAWVVTWSGVTLYRSGPAGMKRRQVLDGSVTMVVDATTGTQLLRVEHGGRP